MKEQQQQQQNRSLNSRLWWACAGKLTHVPEVNSLAYYFPQGHAEHAAANADFAASLGVPAFILCRVAAVELMADRDTDEAFAKIRMVPVPNDGADVEDDDGAGGDVLGSVGGGGGSESSGKKPDRFAKTLTQSDANNGGGFSVPRYCAESIFPPLDYKQDPPVQNATATDIHGQTWTFRHIFRGTPRRHLLTTGWSSFVNKKKLVAGDSIVFLKGDNDEISVGIRRAKRGGSGPSGSGWSHGNCVSKLGGVRSGSVNMRGPGRVRPEAVLEAVTLAANGQPFEVVYYPSATATAFCVKASKVKAAMRIQWCSGMRFRMQFEAEDCSRTTSFMGIVASVQVAEPIRWPNSPWRLLELTWDEPDLLQNLKRVNPWLIEVVNMPIIHFSSFSPPKKKLRQNLDFTLDGHFPASSILGNTLGPSSPLCYQPDTTPAGIQGARHNLFGVCITDLPLNSKLQTEFPSNIQQLNQHSSIPSEVMKGQTDINESLSCLLTMGNSGQNMERSDSVKKHQFILFGQPIVTEQQSSSSSSDAVSQVSSEKNTVDGNTDRAKSLSNDSGTTAQATESDLHTCHCKVFMESKDIGWTLDLSVLGSYEELYSSLANTFGIERSEMLSRVLYHDVTGALKRTGDEPFSEFIRTTKSLTIVTDSGSSSNIARGQILGRQNAAMNMLQPIREVV